MILPLMLLTIGAVNSLKPRATFVNKDTYDSFHNSIDLVFTDPLNNHPHTEDPIIRIDNGLIRGLTVQNIFNRTFYAFLDIPYAAPPVGDLRFRAPTPAKNWYGILNTTENKKTCWEVSLPHKKKTFDRPDEDEDCLYLNVFTPQLFNANDLPVVVFVYGGNFAIGHDWFNEFDPQLLVDTGIVAVVLNYRSGPLGFLSTEDGVIPGNLGLKDQRLALQWTQNNIHYFGGNPSKVTLMGHSSGAISVAFHLLSKKSEGLFRSTIIQSGSVFTPSSIRKHARYYAYQLGKQLSPTFTDRNSSKDLLYLLKHSSASDICNAAVSFYPGTTFLGEKLTGIWSPVIENPHDEDAVVTGPMYEEFLNGRFVKVPTMMGITSEEILFYVNVLKIADWTPYVESPDALVHEDSDIMENKKLEHAIKVKRFYTNTTFQENVGSLFRFLSDSQFRVPVIGQADLQSRFSNVYFYQFSYYGKQNVNEGFEHPVNIPGLGNVGHVEERNYLFLRRPNVWDLHLEYSASDRLTQDRMVKIWTNFIKYMNPTPKKDPLLQNVIWSTVKSGNGDFSFLDIDANLTVIHGYPREYNKWKPLIDTDYQHPMNYF